MAPPAQIPATLPAGSKEGPRRAAYISTTTSQGVEHHGYRDPNTSAAILRRAKERHVLFQQDRQANGLGVSYNNDVTMTIEPSAVVLVNPEE